MLSVSVEPLSSVGSRLWTQVVSYHTNESSTILRVYADLCSLGDDVNPAILSATEHSAGVISACLPTMLPIWNYLRHGRAQPPVEDTTLGPSSAKSSGPRISRMKVKFWPGRSKHDTVSSSPSGSFRRLKGEGAVGMGDLRRPIPPPKGITITTNIETSRRTSSNRADDITSGAGTRQPGW